jgi:hypothetical protein
MNRISRTAAVFAAAAVAALGLAAPAQAHPEINVMCDPVPNSRHSCVVFIEGSAPPVRIRWYIDGKRIPELDDDNSWVRGCALGKSVTAKAVVTDPNGSDSGSDTVRCGGITP